MNLKEIKDIFIQELAPLQNNRVLILDRDGTLNEDSGYVHRIEDLSIVPESINFLTRAVSLGFGLVVATNQGGASLGKFSIDQALEFNVELAKQFAMKGITLSSIYICFHHPNSPNLDKRSCLCRKPQPGMLDRVIFDYGLDKDKTLMLGDQETDAEAAAAAGIGFWKIGGKHLWDHANNKLEEF